MNASLATLKRWAPPLGRRLLQALLVALLVGTLCFFMTRMLPGDTAFRIAAGRYGYDMVDAAAAAMATTWWTPQRPKPCAPNLA